MFQYGQLRCEGISVAQLDGISVLNQPLLPEEIDQEDCKEKLKLIMKRGSFEGVFTRNWQWRAETDYETWGNFEGVSARGVHDYVKDTW